MVQFLFHAPTSSCRKCMNNIEQPDDISFQRVRDEEGLSGQLSQCVDYRAKTDAPGTEWRGELLRSFVCDNTSTLVDRREMTLNVQLTADDRKSSCTIVRHVSEADTPNKISLSGATRLEMEEWMTTLIGYCASLKCITLYMAVRPLLHRPGEPVHRLLKST